MPLAQTFFNGTELLYIHSFQSRISRQKNSLSGNCNYYKKDFKLAAEDRDKYAVEALGLVKILTNRSGFSDLFSDSPPPLHPSSHVVFLLFSAISKEIFKYSIFEVTGGGPALEWWLDLPVRKPELIITLKGSICFCKTFFFASFTIFSYLSTIRKLPSIF